MMSGTESKQLFYDKNAKTNAHKHTRRLYQVYPSKNKFICGGRLIYGPDRIYFFLTIFMTLIPVTVFLVLGCPQLISYYTYYGWLFVALEIIIFLFSTSTFFLCSFSDPGIIPRQKPPSLVNESLFQLLPPTYKEIKLSNSKVLINYQLKYCDTCNFYRPPRVIHCGICNNCVDKFDHHCPWLGNCIGRRNYKDFILYLFSTYLNLLLVSSGLALNIFTIYKSLEYKTFLQVLSQNFMQAIIFLYCAITSLFILYMIRYHCIIISKNQTTNESIKKTFANGNPYNRGCCLNWKFLFFSSDSPQYVLWREKLVK